MKKSILELEGVTVLEKKDQVKINGGDDRDPCLDMLDSCRTTFDTRDEINTCMWVWSCGHIQLGPVIIVTGDL